MRLPALVLLAACGGSATTTSGTTPTTPTSSDEDWRGYLSQLVGPTCKWVGSSSLVSCALGDGTVAVIGWEPNNRRYALWLVDAENVRVLPGIAGNGLWTFETSEAKVTLTKQPAGWDLRGESVGGGAFASGLLETSAPVAPPPAPAPGADTDWRSELQAFVGEWNFTGTMGENPLEYTETCQWLPSATYVFCRMQGSPNFSLTGWEAVNKRFVQVAFDAGVPSVRPGTVANKNWTFSGNGTVTLTRVSPLEFAVRATEPDGSVVEGTYATTPGKVE